jgi:hypothetical protein
MMRVTFQGCEDSDVMLLEAIYDSDYQGLPTSSLF